MIHIVLLCRKADKEYDQKEQRKQEEQQQQEYETRTSLLHEVNEAAARSSVANCRATVVYLEVSLQQFARCPSSSRPQTAFQVRRRCM